MSFNFFEWLLGNVYTTVVTDKGPWYETSIIVSLTRKQWNITYHCKEEVEQAVLAGHFKVPGVDLEIKEIKPMSRFGMVYGEPVGCYILEIIVESRKEAEIAEESSKLADLIG